jgi:DNA-directed RNA polymerase specialized sigma subunit
LYSIFGEQMKFRNQTTTNPIALELHAVDDVDFTGYELKQAIVEAFSEMPETFRLIGEAYYLDGFDEKEISEMCNTSIQVVSTIVHDVKKRLQQHLVKFKNYIGEVAA